LGSLLKLLGNKMKKFIRNRQNQNIGMFFGPVSARRFRSWWGIAVALATVCGYGVGRITSTGAVLFAQSQNNGSNSKQVVAYIYNGIPVTREELGEFLIARGGYQKLELLVNKRIIEIEAARRNLGVTPEEVQAALNENLRTLGISKEDFVNKVLPHYGKTLYEWTEDVIKPRLLLTKMCRDRVKVHEEDIQRAFENKYGERRQAKIIIWRPAELKVAQKQWDEARRSDEDFDRIARMQADPNLAAACGLVAPIGRYAWVDSEGKSDAVEKMLFSLKEGEISQLFQTPAGIMCVKCVKIIPPDTRVKLEHVREELEKEIFDKKLNAEIPKFFGELKDQARPQLLLKGPPTPEEFSEGTRRLIEAAGLQVPPSTDSRNNHPPQEKK